jgi:hypothetical protein
MKARKSRKYRGGTLSDPKTWGNGSYYPYNHSPMLFGGPTYNDVYGYQLGGRRSRRRRSRRYRGGGLFDDRYTVAPSPVANTYRSIGYSLSNAVNNFRGMAHGVNPSPSSQAFLK